MKVIFMFLSFTLFSSFLLAAQQDTPNVSLDSVLVYADGTMVIKGTDLPCSLIVLDSYSQKDEYLSIAMTAISGKTKVDIRHGLCSTGPNPTAMLGQWGDDYLMLK